MKFSYKTRAGKFVEYFQCKYLVYSRNILFFIFLNTSNNCYYKYLHHHHHIILICALQFSHAQLGIAIGFVVPPFLVGNHDDLTMIGNDLRFMFYLVAGFSTVILVLVVFCEYPN